MSTTQSVEFERLNAKQNIAPRATSVQQVLVLKMFFLSFLFPVF
jgi:hypothetical protein